MKIIALKSLMSTSNSNFIFKAFIFYNYIYFRFGAIQQINSDQSKKSAVIKYQAIESAMNAS